MRTGRLLFVAAILAVASLGGATVASAHTLVDPTTLTPPLKPFRVCYEDGPWVKCDTSGPTEVSSNVNEPMDDFGLPCGSLYEQLDDDVSCHALVCEPPARRNETREVHVVGTWSPLADRIRADGRVRVPTSGYHEAFPRSRLISRVTLRGRARQLPLRVPALGP